MIERIKNNKIIKIVIISVLALIILGLIYYFTIYENNSYGKDKIINNHNIKITNNDTKSLYKILTNVNCNGFEEIKFSKNEMELEELSEKLTVKYVLSYIDKDNKLNDVDKSMFKEYAIKLFGDKYGKKLSFNTIEFNGNKYTYGKKFKIEKTNECSNDKYITKIYGYSYIDEYLYLDIAIGKKKGDKIFDLDGKEIDEQLTTGTIYRYIFKRENENTYLNSISKIKLVTK